jgi:hypothetical protein
MRIGVDLNDVLRDTAGKFTQVYEKYLVNANQDFFAEKTYTVDESGNTELNEVPDSFEYKIISDVTTSNLMNHFAFQSEEELYDFMYNDYTMEIFGHAGSTEISGMNDFNDFYLEFRDNHDILIVSNEMGKSKPASLFFMSKFGCLVESVKFYNNITINSIWDSIDVLLTANPNLLLNHPKDKVVIKFTSQYNTDVKVKHEISSIKELKTKIKELYD